MVRIFLPPDQLTAEYISITGDQARHLALVLRTQPGDRITVLDGQGNKYECRILTVRKIDIQAKIISKSPYSAESPIVITLAQGLPKSDKMDFIVQKSTELGVNRIIPLITDRSQIRRTEKIDRWRKIAISSSQQCGRENIPQIDEPLGLKEFVMGFPSTICNREGNSLPIPFDREGENLPLKKENAGECYGIIFSEGHKARHLKEVLTQLKNIRQIILIIGPEGGFSEDEIASAVEKGFIKISLGRRILRTETAPVTALSIIQYEIGDVG